MTSSTPPRHSSRISSIEAKHTHRTTTREMSIRLAAERWTLRSRPTRSEPAR